MANQQQNQNSGRGNFDVNQPKRTGRDTEVTKEFNRSRDESPRRSEDSSITPDSKNPRSSTELESGEESDFDSRQ